MFTRLYLEDFRIFKDQTIHIGNTITAIAGHNATGKSTILGILGNTCELKSKFGTTITDKQFKTEFSELFKGSKAFDKRSGDIGTLFYLPQDNDNEIPITLRVTWQKWDKDSVDSNRFRILPKWVDHSISEKVTAKKLSVPSFYLGLQSSEPDALFTNHSLAVLPYHCYFWKTKLSARLFLMNLIPCFITFGSLCLITLKN